MLRFIVYKIIRTFIQEKQKRRGSIKTFQTVKRYFRVDVFEGEDTSLSCSTALILSYYYRKQQIFKPDEARGWVFIHDITRIYAGIDTKSNKDYFIIEHPARNWTLFALTYDDHSNWFHTLTRLWQTHKVDFKCDLQSNNPCIATTKFDEDTSVLTKLNTKTPPSNTATPNLDHFQLIPSKEDLQDDLSVFQDISAADVVDHEMVQSTKSCLKLEQENVRSDWHESFRDVIGLFDQMNKENMIQSNNEESLIIGNKPDGISSIRDDHHIETKPSASTFQTQKKSFKPQIFEENNSKTEKNDSKTKQKNNNFRCKVENHARWVYEDWDNKSTEMEEHESLSSLSDWDKSSSESDL